MNGRFLALDVGAGKIFLSEYAVKGGVPELVAVAAAERDPLEAGASRNEPLVALADTVKQMMAASGIKPAPLCVMLSGQQVFLRFAKIPGATPALVDDMIRNEAAEHLPFPLDQVVWDSARLGVDPVTDEIDALIVAAKSETAADAAGLAAAVGLPLAAVDAVPLALCNAVRRSHPELDGCTLLLDIGARSTNLVFLEGSKVFLRTIPIAGNTMTSELSRGLGVEPAEAESLKKEIGFVALGGTTGVEGDERADRASKILRNVATRLHSEITRSINFYRGQQGGSAPVRVLLTGGGSLTRHLDTFFREKLGVEVDFFNPFAKMGAAPSVGADDTTLFLLAPSTGVAWREAGGSPVGINLVPPEIVARRKFLAKLPFLALSAVFLILSLAFFGVYAGAMSAARADQAREAERLRSRLQSQQNVLKAAAGEADAAISRSDAWAALALSRSSWQFTLDAVRHALLRSSWLVSVARADSSSDNGSVEGEGEGGSAFGSLDIVARGFKSELDKLPGKGSAGEKMLSNLLRTKLFSGGQVVGEPPLDGNRVLELRIRVDLARPLGRPDSSWIPAPPEQKADGDAEGGDDAASEDLQ